jgi:acyl carrier protein
MNEFYEGMAEILEIEPSEIRPDLSLEDVSWDSLAVVSTIALVDDVYGVTLNPNALAECSTIADIERLAEAGRDAG